MPKTLFSKSFPSTTEAIGQAVNEALEALSSHGWCTCKQDNFCLRLCLEEALINAITHGNSNVSTRSVHLEILEDGEQCRVCVTDEGQGFNPQEYDMPDCEELGGRGVCLIKHFMDDVHFDKIKNCLHMIFRRGSFERKEQSHAK